MVWTQIIWFIVTTLVSIALAPKPKAPRAAALEDFDFPTAEEGRPIPVVFGTVHISGPNVLWYGQLQVKAIRKRSGFSKSTVGYKYFIAFHLGLCHGPVNKVKSIRWGDKQVWSGNVTNNSQITVDRQDIWGGEKRGGGVNGRFDIMMGAPTQTANSYLSAVQTGPQPGYRGILGAVWRGGYVGTSESIRGIEWEIQRTTAGWNTDLWYSEKAEITDPDAPTTTHMNPAHICWQLLTDPEWGMGTPTAMLNDEVWKDAADVFHAENFGLSMLWNQQTTIEEFLKIVMDHAGAAIALRTATSQFELVPIRGGYDPDELMILDPSNVKEMVDYQRQGWGETVNEVTLVYTDPSTGKDTAISAQDLGNQEAQGRRISATVEMPGIRQNSVAERVVARELAARVTPLGKGQLIVNRAGWRLPYNSVFKLTWPERGIDEVVHRVLSINRGVLTNNELVIDFVEDIYGQEIGNYVTTEPQAPDDDPPETPEDEGDTGIGVISTTQTDPPTGANDGDSYYVPQGATGEWAGHDGQYADWDEETGTWVFTDAEDGALIFDSETGATYQYQNGELVPFGDASMTISSEAGSISQVREIRFEGDVVVTEATGGTAVVEVIGGGGGGTGGSSLIYADGTVPGANVVANTNIETAFSSQYTIPLADLQTGAVIKFEARGTYGTAASAGTLRVRAKLGTVTVLDTLAFTATNSVANRGWTLSGTMIITVAGAVGQIEAQGLGFFATAAATGIPVFLLNTAKVAVDLSTPRALTVTVQWGTANAANSMTLRTFTINKETTEAGSVAILPVSLLHFEAPDATTFMLDMARKSWVRGGVAQIDTAQFKFGSSSLLLNGTTDYIESNSDEDFAFGTGDFTIECFVRFDTRAGNNFVFTFGAGWGLYTRSNGWAVYNGAGSEVILPVGTVADDTWYHVALVRSGTTLILFANGTLLGSVSDSTNHTQTKIRIGAQPGGLGFMHGWIDEFRVHRVALYTSSFVAPASAFTDFVAPAYEVSLLHFEGADATTVFTDELGKIWTQGGTAQIDTAQSKFGASSLLDPDGQSHIITTSHADFGFGNGNFTIEFWFRPTSLASDQILFDGRTSISQNRPMLRHLGLGDVRYFVAGTDRIASATGVLVVGTWAHIAVCRYNGNTKLFVNGTQVGSTYADATSYEACPAVIGNAGDALGSGFGAVGHFDEVRITKGHAWYTENFLVPTAEFMSPSGLSLVTYDPFDGVALAAAWTPLNTATFITPVVSGGSASLNFSGGADGLPHGYTQPAVSSPVLPRHYRLQTGTNSSFSTQMAGIALRDSATGNWIMFGRHQGQLAVLRFNSTNYFGTSYANASNPYENVWLEIIDDGVSLYFRYSVTGVEGSFIQVNTQTRASFLTTVNQVFIGHFGGAGAASTLQCLTFEVRQGPV